MPIGTKLFALMLLITTTCSANAQESDLKESPLDIVGRVTIYGDLPKLTPLITKNLAAANQICLQPEVPDESLIVGTEGGLANVFVFLKRLPANLTVPKTKLNSSLHCKDCRFTPHAQIAFAGQHFSLLNEDPVDASFHYLGFSNDSFNVVLTAHFANHEIPTVRQSFKNAESFPAKVVSNLHPWMTAWILPVDHPYAAVTDQDGHFTIPGLPAGTYEFRVWHERVGWLEKSLSIEIVKDKPTEIELMYPADRF